MTLSSLTTIPADKFFAKAAAFLKKYENAPLIGDTTPTKDGAIHNDSKNIPTVGYGLNLRALTSSKIEAAFKYALTGSTNGPLTEIQKQGLAIVLKWRNDTTPSLKEDLAFIAKSRGTGGTLQERAALKSLWLTDAQASDLLEAFLKGKSGLFPSMEKALADKLSALGATLPASSNEKLALLSLYYNAPSLIGKGVASAIATDNHAKLWFEIRYGHTNPELQDRRDAESDLIDVLGPADRKDPERVVYAMDYLFDRTGGSSSVYERIIAHDVKKTFPAKIDKYMDVLSDEYAHGNTVHFVQVGSSKSETITAGVAKHLSLSEANTNDLVFGQGGSDSISTGGGNDVIYGGSKNDSVSAGTGNDYIETFAGDDRLDGGAGVDTMVGGKGRDTYRIDNANDRIIDNDLSAVEAVASLTKLWTNVDHYTNLKAGLSHSFTLRPDVLPVETEDDYRDITFTGSSGEDRYVFTMAGGLFGLDIDTNGGADRLTFKPGLGTVSVHLAEPSGDTIDLTEFHAKKHGQQTGHDEGWFYTYLPGELSLIYESDGATVQNVLYFYSDTPFTLSMFQF